MTKIDTHDGRCIYFWNTKRILPENIPTNEWLTTVMAIRTTTRTR